MYTVTVQEPSVNSVPGNLLQTNTVTAMVYVHTSYLPPVKDAEDCEPHEKQNTPFIKSAHISHYLAFHFLANPTEEKAKKEIDQGIKGAVIDRQEARTKYHNCINKIYVHFLGR